MTAPVPTSEQEPELSALPEKLEHYLRDNLLPRWESLKEVKLLDQIVLFAHELTVAARHYDVPDLIDYAEQLIDACEYLDVLAAGRTINQFPESAEKLISEAGDVS